ncbi:hsp90 co-chaperone Cdc37-like [Ptychodera flava]|uniref:hsp90 co-chaperone Cdc37-like n=1 Tax=Ptychodera flava TaxID=63121 RepID=UPI003969CD53
MVDYSKWDHIEISDDEDDTHPNIDTPSLFRWRHQARVERMEESKKEKEEFIKKSTQARKNLEETRQRFEQLCVEGKKDSEEGRKLQDTLKEYEKQTAEWKKKEDEIAKKERLTPWNVDTIGHDAWQKTIINKYDKDEKDVKDMTDEELSKRHRTFVEKNETKIKKFGMMRRWDDSMEFLVENPNLTCEETANYLAIWAIDLEVEEKHGLMEQVAHQTIVMQYILELAKSMKEDPRACIRPFFTKIKKADKMYKDCFNDELESFKERVRGRAKARIDEAMKQAEEEMRKERESRLGPGGLDPVEVFESLPKSLQSCFESKNIELLQKTLMEMDSEEAKYHMKRCVDSGMWVPEAKQQEGAAGEESEEPVYENPDQ